MADSFETERTSDRPSTNDPGLGSRAKSVQRSFGRRWLPVGLGSAIVIGAIIVWLSGNQPANSTDIDLWTFPAPSLYTITRGENTMYDLGDGFFGLRVFRQGQWFARIDIPDKFQDDMHTAVKLAVLKSLRVANSAQYDRPDVCRLVVRLTGAPSSASSCPVRDGITADAEVVWKTVDGQTAVLVGLRFLG